MERISRYSRWILPLSVALLLVGLTTFPQASRADHPPSPEQIVQRAWQRAQQAGAYRFATEIAQTTYPAPALANVGRSSRQALLHLEGRVDLPAHALQMSLWKGGSIAAPNSAVEVRLEGGQGYGRAPGGQWQEIEDFSDAFAPGNDLMAYLAGAKNIRELGSETRQIPSNLQFTRYAFDLDGPAFASHLRDQLETLLREKGELPPGLILDSSNVYREMTGSGEIWLDGDGLPLRLTVHLVYPEQDDGERVEADVQTDFSAFDRAQLAAAQTGPARWAAALGLPRTLDGWQRLGRQSALAAGMLGLLAALVVYRRSRKVYATFVLVIILSMVVGPLLQSSQVHAFAERTTAQQAEQERQRQTEDAARELQETLASNWDPHLDPLAGEPAHQPVGAAANLQLPASNLQFPTAILAASTDETAETDSDSDGLTDTQEDMLGTDKASANSDSDGLNDGAEVLRLGTNPLAADSDGDGINDNVEVQGFTLSGQTQRWYLNPNNPDSNGDGQPERVECPELVGVSSVPASVTCDMDGDTIPDPFDLDNDNDGVLDRVDLSPNGVVDRNGKRANAGSLSPFDAIHPFALQVSNLTAGYPAFVDFQLRPITATHLTYALSVLDWPGGDLQGQIQRGNNTTFATTDNLSARNTADPRSANGDMRLVPMLEIQIKGNANSYQVPLALTTPIITVEVRGPISATVRMEQQSANTRLTFTFSDTQSYYAKIHPGPCMGAPTIADETVFVSNSDRTRTLNNVMLVDRADGAHSLTVFNGDGTRLACEPIGNIVNGLYRDKMVDPAPLAPFGVSVREADASGTLLAYAPLNVVPDETGGGRAAFGARMIYWPGASATWQQAQQVRVVWVVQMLTDWCDITGFAPSAAAITDTVQYNTEHDAWCAAHRSPDQVQVVQTYDEQWYLTGLAVREDRGLDVAIVNENPATDQTPDAEDPLWQMGRGLLAVFVTGRDCEDSNPNNGEDYIAAPPSQQRCRADTKRDIVVAPRNNGNTTIASRFAITTTSTSTERWGIPANALLVHTFSYTHENYITWIAMQETRAILQGHFATTAAPTLLFAREETFRSANMESSSVVSGAITLDLGSGAPTTMAALSWSPYRYNSNLGPDGQVIGWEAYPMSEYWDRMEVAFKAGFRNVYPQDADKTIIGRMVAARSFYLALNAGTSGLVNSSGQLTWSPPWLSGEAADDSNVALTGGITSIINNSYWVISDVIDAFVQQALKAFRTSLELTAIFYKPGLGDKTSAFLDCLGDGLQGIKASWLSAFNPANSFGKIGALGKIGLAVMVGVAVMAVVLTIVAATQAENALDVVGYVMSALNVIVLLKGLMSAVKEFVETGAQVTRAALTNAAKWGENVCSKVAVIGLVIGILVTWAVLAVTLALSQMSHIQQGQVIARAVADTIVLVIMFIINAIPLVGAIIANVIWLIDALISALCGVFGWSEEEEGDTDPYNDAGDWLCGGIEGLVSNVLAWLFYAGTVMVDIEAPDHFQISGVDTNDLLHPEMGLALGNSILAGASFTNTIQLVDKPNNIGAAYWYQWSDERLRGATFDYQLQTAEADLHEGLERYTMSGQWQYVDGTSPPAGDAFGWWHVAEPVFVTRTLRSDAGFLLTEAGINRPLPVILSEGWAIPAQECILDVCGIRTERDTRHYDLGDGIQFDVFPATLDGFYTLQQITGGSWALAWGQTGNLTFPRLRDADNDGLSAGPDPNDSLWDSDYDGLSDFFERQIGSNPNSRDGDGDGLGDADEARLGTNPARRDSDGDGLWDGQEVWHQDAFDQDHDGNTAEWVGGWLFAYGMDSSNTPLTTWVISDPLSADADRDTLSDYQEYTFGFNPNVPSVANVLTLASQVQELTPGGVLTPTDGVVRAGGTFYYSATVKNELDLRYAQGLLSTDFPVGVDASAVPPQSFILQPQERRDMAGSVAVSGATASGAYSLTQVAGALITNWSELASGAALWLPFEDAVTSTVFLDHSGAVPVHNGACVGSGCAAVKNDGRYGGALRLNGSGYVASAYDPPETAYAVSLWISTTQASATLFSVNDKYGTQVYLQNGKVCADVNYSAGLETVCSTGAYNNSQWHHVVHTFGGVAGSQKIYADGLEEARGSRTGSAVPNTGPVNIGRSSQSGRPWFNGLLDDVRVYPDGISAAQVWALFNQPVFTMRFDETSGWRDYSTFGNDGSCSNCPSRVSSSVAGQAAQFGGSNYLSVGSDPSLKLSGGRFTLAAWVYPDSASPTNCVQTYYNSCQMIQPQGILGLDSSEANAYPTLQRAGRKVRFGIGTGSTPMPYYVSGDVLTEDAWNHVAATFDRGVVKLYVNGELKGENSSVFTGTVPVGTQSFTLGRSGDQATLTIGSIAMTNCDDEGTGKTCELCLVYSSGGSSTELFNQDVKMGDYTPTIFDVNKTVTVYGTGTLRMWENDSGERCGAAPDGSSPYADDGIGTWTFSSNDASTHWRPGYIRTYDGKDFTGQVSGSFSFLYDNDSIPFYGKVDEVQIYQQVLDENAVLDLYRNTAVALQMRFDEPPGETSFRNVADNAHQGACSGSACPTAGVEGRVNQSAWFVPAEQDRVTLSNLGDFGVTTVAAWVYRTGSTGARETIVSYKEGGSCGFVLALAENTDHYPKFWVKVGSSWQSVQNTTPIPLNTWVHLAGTYDGQTLRLYRNGQQVATTAVSGAMSQCTAGSAIGSRSSGDMHYFPGRIDDVAIYGRALTAAEIGALYRRAPVLQLHFEEARGAAQFADSSGNGLNGSCVRGTQDYCPQAGEAIQGRLGQAVEFDGRGDIITVPDAAALDLNTFSVSAWVMPTAESGSTYQEIVGKYHYAGYGGVKDVVNYQIYLQPNGLVPVFAMNNQGWCNAGTYQAISAVPLIKNQWNHVMGTFDGTRLRIYVNGALQGTYNAPAALTPCQNDEPLRIGGYYSNYPYRSDDFAGRIDEVTIYNGALTESEVHDIFAYQAGWVEDRETHDIVVDAENPTAVLTGTTTYRPNQDVQLLILAADPTSHIVSAGLGACKSTGSCAASSYTWTSAPICSDAAGDGAWCPRFVPSGEGRYLLRGRAADQVGHVFTTTTDVTVYVDDSAPTIAFGFAADARLDATLHPTAPDAWGVHLSGTVSDPALADGSAGSGVRSDGVWVTLYAADGGLAGSARQRATLAGSAWSIDYALGIVQPNAQPTGRYTVTVEAADEVTRLPELSEAQLARHTATVTRRIQIDATAPAAHLDQASLPSNGIAGTLAFDGDATERPVALDLAYTTVNGAGGQVSMTLSCSGVTLYAVAPGTLVTPTATYGWSGTAHKGAACQVSTSGSVTGTVQVCGSSVASWTAASTGVSFSATSSTCDSDTAVAGVSQVQFAFAPIQYGSPFANEAPPAGQVMHLPLDDTQSGNTTLTFRDISGRGHTGACSGVACPTDGQLGRLGRAVHFDGVDDRIDVPDSNDFRFGAGAFAVSLWLRMDQADTRQVTILSKDWNAYVGFSIIVLNGHLLVRLTNYSSYALAVDNGGAISPGAWHHVVVTRDGSGHFTTYIDGAATGSGNRGLSLDAMQAPVRLGAPTYDAYGVYLKGSLDDVRLFNRLLSAGEVKALYLGTGPALVLPFDESWVGDGAALPDLSGGAHDAALHTGDAANKATAGAVGPYALSFDGVDDYASVGPHSGLDLSGGRFTLAAWVYPSPQHNGAYPILSSAAYHEGRYQYPFMQVVTRTQLAVGFGNGSALNTFTTGSILTENVWNHVVAAFDGITTTIYINGVVRAATGQFSGQAPHPAQRFDVGRGTDVGGVHTCGHVTLKSITPNTWGQLFFIAFGGGTFQSPWYPTNGQSYAINLSNDFCGTDYIQVIYYADGVSTLLGNATVNATPGSYSHTFAAAGQSATVYWDVTADPAHLLSFRGALDDVRVYPRALSTLEVQALYGSVWRNASTSPSGAGVTQGFWSAQTPAGLEGIYRLDLRGRDTGGHLESTAQWQGSVDTLAPRVAITRTAVGTSTYRYAVQAQDFDLSEAGFQSPCGAGFITDRQYYQSAWYLGLTGDAQRLYQLTAQCDLPTSAMLGETGAYEGAGMAQGVAISGSLAYVADGSSGLRVIDVSNPALPVLLGTYDTPGYARAVALAGPQGLGASAASAEAAPTETSGENPAVQAVRPTAPTGRVSEPSGVSAALLLSPGPDLVFENLATEPASPDRNQTFVVSATIRNQGTVSTTISQVWLFSDRQVSGVCFGPMMGDYNVWLAPLAPAASTTVTFTHSGFANAGQHRLYAIVDGECWIIEDNEDNNTYGPLLVPVDIFTVTATSPAGNGRVIARDGVISATFSQPVSSTTVSTRTFTVHGRQTGVYTGVGQIDNLSYVFDATSIFKPGEEIVAHLSNGMRATSGDVLLPYAWQFRAAAVGGTGVLTDSGQRLGVEQTRAVALGDLDGDGDLDAFAGNDGPDLVWVNDGTGSFPFSLQGLGASSTQAVALGDLDGDGDLDAFTGNGDAYGAEPNQVWLNDGLGNFADSGQTMAFSQTTSVALGDLDGDGDLDAFVGNAATYDWDCLPDPCPLEGGSQVWLNDGTGVFTDSGQMLGFGLNNTSVALGDLDGDGDLDALVGNRGGDATSVWLNDGAGHFTDSGQTLAQTDTRAVALGDLDGDGDLDAFIGNYGSANTVWLNDGAGHFTNSGQTLGSEWTAAVALSDLDGDGDLDALVGNASTGSRVWLNDGTGTFTDSGHSMPVGVTYGWAVAVALGDLDGDGDLDAFVGNTGDPDGADTVWINNANSPVANDDSFTVPENSTYNLLDVLANDTDADGDALHVVAVGDPITGVATTDGSAVIYTPTLAFSGTVVFTYTASDPGGLTATATLTVTVAGVNDPPAAQDDTATTNEDTPVTIDALANDSDPDGQTLFVSAVDIPAHGSAAIIGSQVAYTPSADYNGADVFAYVASDGTLTDTATITVTVASVNDPPSFTKGADQTVAEDSGPRSVAGWATNIRRGPVTAVDEAAQVLAFTLTNDNPALFSAPPSLNAAGTLAFTPAANAHGSAIVTATLQDSGGTANGGQDTSLPQTFAITVTSVNDPPVASNVVTTTLEDTPVSIAIVPAYASDPADGDPVSLVAVGSPSLGVVTISGLQSLIYTPTLNLNGLDTFTYTVGDPGGLRTTARITVTVSPVNDPPTLAPLTDLVIDENAPTQTVTLSGISSGAANEAQVLTVTATSTNTALIPHPAVTYVSPNATGSLRFAPLADRFGVAGIVVTVTDGPSMTARSFRVTVRPVGALAYVADDTGGLRVVDVAKPATPRLIGVFDPAWHVNDVAVSGTLAYVAAGFSGLRVLDISDPTALHEVGDFGWNDGNAIGVAIAGTLAYVADGNYSRLRVVNVANPANPYQIGVYTTTGNVYDVAVAGRYAYVACGGYGLRVVNVSNPASPQFVGEIDTLDAHGVAISGTLAYVADGLAGLRVVNISNPATPSLLRTFDTPGYALGLAVSRGLAYVADNNKGLRIINAAGADPHVQVCDTAGNCATSVFSTQQLAAGVAQSAISNLQSANLSVSILNVPAVLDSADPISVTGEARAFVSSLRALTLTVDGAPIYSTAWASGAYTETLWTADWTPASEGVRELQALLTAWNGDAVSTTLTTTVDTQPPEIIVAPTLFTSTSYYEPRTLDLTGLVSDTGGVASVWVGQDGVLSTEATVAGNTWRAAWTLGDGPLPDGAAFTVTAEATDIVGRKTQVTQTVLVDVAPPASVALSLTSGGNPVAPGATLREVSPTLTLTWTASSDGSGLAGYRVRWTTQVTGTAQTAEVSQTLEVSEMVAGEGQQVSAYVAGEDIYGQQSWQGAGPVYVDSPLTPDYIWMDTAGQVGDLPYHGWMESGCTLVGVDRRVAESARAGAALHAEQRFYATWNAEALRLAWTGANWNTDGDLFIYLDTQPGGATTAFDPYRTVTSTTVISLPDTLTADALAWVRDSGTALLLQWNGGDWISPTLLSGGEYRFDASLNSGQTDLYLPFDWPGLTVGSSLDMVAFASDEDALSLWATAPAANPVNSSRVIATEAFASSDSFALAQLYHWDSLADGVCPNGSTGGAATPYLDADLRVSITSDPPGAAYSLLGDNLFWLQSLLLGSPPADVTSYLDFMDTATPPLGDGQAITYTIHYRNQGTYTATHVTASVSPSYTLALTPGDETVLLGDIGPGEEGAATFGGVVDTGRSAEPWAAVAVAITDDAHPSPGQPLEWLWAHHPVDNRAPEFFGIQQPGYVIGVGTADLGGYAYDDAGVPGIEAEVQSPTGTLTIPCPDAQPDDGQWTCAWDVTAGNGGVPPSDGTLFDVRLHATDGLGQDAWGDPLPFLVDARPPTVTLDVTATQAISGSLLRDSAFALAGSAFDDASGVAQVDVCVEGDCGVADLQLTVGAAAVSYEDAPADPIAIGGGAGCVTRFFTVTEAFAIAQVSLGFTAEHPRRDDLQVELTSPANTHVQVLADDGISGSAFRHYDVLLNDGAPAALADAAGDDDPSGSFYDRLARPYAPLQAFQGESSQGVWRLRVCDTNLASNAGGYIRSRLALAPRDTAAKSARWFYRTPAAGALDYVSRTVAISGQDVVGNHTADPLGLVVWVDNVAPVITVTETVAEFYVGEGVTTVLSGTVTEGGPLSDVSVLVQTPAGELEKYGAARDGDGWWFDLQPWNAGRYTLWVTARDLAGNEATVGPFELEVKMHQVFLPLVARNFAVAPDLVVERLTVNPNNVTVVIRNQGDAPTADEFWVDVYVNPDPAPTHVNQIWNDLSDQGLVWGVTTALAPGQALTLTVGGAYYVAEYSQVSWPLPAGAQVYAQVDSANADTTYGGVLENHEITGGPYNNIAGPVNVTAVAGEAAAVSAAEQLPALPGTLPRRP